MGRNVYWTDGESRIIQRLIEEDTNRRPKLLIALCLEAFRNSNDPSVRHDHPHQVLANKITSLKSKYLASLKQDAASTDDDSDDFSVQSDDPPTRGFKRRGGPDMGASQTPQTAKRNFGGVLISSPSSYRPVALASPPRAPFAPTRRRVILQEARIAQPIYHPNVPQVRARPVVSEEQFHFSTPETEAWRELLSVSQAQEMRIEGNLAIPRQTQHRGNGYWNYPMLKIFAGSANSGLAVSIAKELGQSLGEISLGQFPDGETKIEINDPIRGHDVFVIQPTCPSVNDNLMQLLIMLDAIKRSSPSRVTAVIPYYGYARQDRKHGPREPITAKLVADLLSVAGPDRVLFLDLHAIQIQGFFDIPADDLHADSLIIDYFAEKGLSAQNTTIVAINNGGARRVRRVALLTGAKIALIESRQHQDGKTLNVVGSLAETCIIIDDILDTGNKVCAAAALLKDNGAKNVYVWATHPVLSTGAQHIQDSAIDEIATTDSIPMSPELRIPKIKVLSVAPLIAEAIRRIHNEETLAGYV